MGTMAGGWINDLDDGVLLYWAGFELKENNTTGENIKKHRHIKDKKEGGWFMIQ